MFLCHPSVRGSVSVVCDVFCITSTVCIDRSAPTFVTLASWEITQEILGKA